MSDLAKCHFIEKTGNIVLPRGRMHFCAISEKFISKSDKSKGKTVDKDGAYVVTMVVPPSADLTVLKAKVKEKAIEKWGTKLPGNMKSPIRKCSEIFDSKGDPKYSEDLGDHYQISANTYTQQPGLMDSKGVVLNKRGEGESIDDVKARVEEECYAGRYARISVSPATYDTDGNRGVKLYLQNIQLLDHGEVLGGRSSRAEDEFQAVGEVAGGDKAADSIFD
jgi:hypothetical protein